eukprot:6275637-Amphidinium_carterae.1
MIVLSLPTHLQRHSQQAYVHCENVPLEQGLLSFCHVASYLRSAIRATMIGMRGNLRKHRDAIKHECHSKHAIDSDRNHCVVA